MPTKTKKKSTKTEYAPARARVSLTPGDSVRVARELQGFTQAELAAASKIPQGTISSIENGRVTLGAERVEKLARALQVHPAVLLWPNWDAEVESKRGGERHAPNMAVLTPRQADHEGRRLRARRRLNPRR